MDKFEELKEALTIEELEEMLRDCISYDGSFEDLDYYMFDEEFFKMYYMDNPMEVCRATAYGNVNFADEYIRINAYGNLESCNQYEYEAQIEDQEEEIIEHYLELYADNNVYPSSSLESKLYDFYDEDE